MRNVKPQSCLRRNIGAKMLLGYAKTIPGSKYVVDRRAHAAVDLTVTGVSSQ